MIKIKGYEFNDEPVKDATYRKGIQLQNQVKKNLTKIGIDEDQIDVSDVKVVIASKKAFVSWYFDGQHYYIGYSKKRYIDNLNLISQVIKKYCDELTQDKISIEDFLKAFKEEEDVEDLREKARNYFELEENFTLTELDKKYKTLAKKYHPDMNNGDTEKFKELNVMHKTLKREFN